MAADEAEDLRAWLALLRAPGIGPAWGRQLLEEFHTPLQALSAGPASWERIGLPRALHPSLRKPDAEAIERDVAWLGGANRHFVSIEDERYPAALKEVAQAPLALFCQGDVALLGGPQIAIVGARAASPEGLDNARKFASVLAKAGLVVTSGLAQGVDGAAHRGALDAGGNTIAVCGTGLDRVYPAKHRELAHEISAKGLLVSEFSPGMPPMSDNFPRRNRVISGLSLGVLVVEAAARSGSLITARLALEQGRDVFAIPGSIHNPAAKGCHALIRQGAKLVDSARDILEEVAPRLGLRVPAEKSSPSLEPKLDAPQRKVLEAIGHSATSFDTLVERVAMSVEELSSVLLMLELDGLIAAAPGGAFLRRG
ncbi:MAG TPA: DNA-processing protein DprA [Nevskiaceae bacterium]|nr:DNA-processing protein DprA [Nevskiaceae bacterium]